MQIELVLWNHFDVAVFAAFLSYRFVVLDLRGCIALSIQPRHLFIPKQVIIDFYDTVFKFKEVYIGSLGYVRYKTLGTSGNWNCKHLGGLGPVDGSDLWIEVRTFSFVAILFGLI